MIRTILRALSEIVSVTGSSFDSTCSCSEALKNFCYSVVLYRTVVRLSKQQNRNWLSQSDVSASARRKLPMQRDEYRCTTSVVMLEMPKSEDPVLAITIIALLLWSFLTFFQIYNDLLVFSWSNLSVLLCMVHLGLFIFSALCTWSNVGLVGFLTMISSFHNTHQYAIKTESAFFNILECLPQQWGKAMSNWWFRNMRCPIVDLLHRLLWSQVKTSQLC